MLEALNIKNFAIIEDIEINFKNGMNVLLGETGAGKSIIIDALALLKGERSSFDKIRSGATKAYIDGRFIVENKELIKEINEKFDDLIEDDELIVTRSLDISGRSSIKLNGRIFSTSQTRLIMDEIIDIHSQHQNMTLFNEKEHLKLLDCFIGNNPLLTKYKDNYKNYVNAKNELEQLENKVIDEVELAYKKTLIDEINDLNLQDNEYNNLLSLEQKMANYVKISEAVNNVDILLDGQDGAISKIYDSRRQLDYLKDDDLEKYINKLNNVYYDLKDLNDSLKDMLSEISGYEYSPEYIQERLFKIKKVMRKYGQEQDDIIQAKERLLEEINLMSDYEYAVNRKKEEVNMLKDILNKCGQDLHSCRLEFAKKLETQINQELEDLSLKHAKFKVEIIAGEFNKFGLDQVSFLISSNVGMPYAPIKAIASGGEASRLMLGLKTVFAKFSNFETMIFDEIDSGVSGKVASSVGRKIHQISSNRQVIVISHIPQVISYGDQGYEIQKTVANNTTKTSVRELDEEQFIYSIAKLLTDNTVKDESLALAKELYFNSRK